MKKLLTGIIITSLVTASLSAVKQEITSIETNAPGTIVSLMSYKNSVYPTALGVLSSVREAYAGVNAEIAQPDTVKLKEGYGIAIPFDSEDLIEVTVQIGVGNDPTAHVIMPTDDTFDGESPSGKWQLKIDGQGQIRFVEDTD